MKDPKPYLSEAAMKCNLDYYAAIVDKARADAKMAQSQLIRLTERSSHGLRIPSQNLCIPKR